MTWFPHLIDLEYNVQTDCCNASPYPEKSLIIDYLHRGKIDIAASGSAEDAFTGETIKGSYVGLNDGTYHWWSTTAYYVDRYNLRLPQEFVQHAINRMIIQQ